MRFGARTRNLLGGVAQLVVAAVAVQGGLVLYRFAILPPLASAFSLGPLALTVARRFGVLATIVLAYAAYVRWYERRTIPELRIRPWWMLAGGAAGALGTLTPILVLAATGHYSLLGHRGWGLAGGVLTQIGIAALIEEVQFRGVLFRVLESRIGSIAALVISSVVFSLAHVANDGFHPVTFIDVTLAGMMWAGVYAVSRNLWVAAAHHACWNAVIFLSGLPLSGQGDWRARAPFIAESRGATLWTGGAFGPEDSLVSMILCAAVCVGLWVMARRLDPTWPRRGTAASSEE